jgi:Fic family protein
MSRLALVFGSSYAGGPIYTWQHPDWPRFRWDDGALLEPVARLAEQRGRLLSELDTLGLADRTGIEVDAFVGDALDTSGIEGQALPPQSVRSSVAYRLGLDQGGVAPRRRDVEGLVEVLVDATQRRDQPLTAERLWGWHAALFPTGHSGIDRIVVGAWRTTPIQVLSGVIGEEQVHFSGPPHERVPDEMAALIDWWRGPSRSLEGVQRAGIAHLWFETIHPFEDGNGRIGRALADMALAQADGTGSRVYGLSSQILEDRSDYYRALKTAQAGNLDVTDWLVWFIRCVERAVMRARSTVARLLEGSRIRALATGLNERQLKVVNRLIEAGRDGFEGGLNNRKYRGITGASKATATRDLAELERRGFLLRGSSGGRSTGFQLDWALGESTTAKP